MADHLKKIEATFEIVTPMFLGGAGHEATRIRETSIKGALAFWWRALNFARYVEQAGGNQDAALEAMRQRELELFGGPKGQGKFLLKVIGNMRNEDVLRSGFGQVLGKNGETVPQPRERDDTRIVGVGARYLGYGVIDAFTAREKPVGSSRHRPIKNYEGQLIRSCLKSGRRFTLQILFKPHIGSRDIEEIVQSLKVFGFLGGLGSRVRRGWGAVAITEIKAHNLDIETQNYSGMNLEHFKKCLVETLSVAFDRQCSGETYRITAFSNSTSLYIGSDCSSTNPLSVLDGLGRGFLRYRANGQGGKPVGGQAIDASFRDDHDWFKTCNRFAGGRGEYIPKRTAFGLPHNYNSKTFGVTGSDGVDRRASPLFFHVHKIKDCYVATALFFHNLFLPNPTVDVWEKRGNSKTTQTINYDFDPVIVENFLNGVRHNDSKASVPASAPYFPSERLLP